MKVCNICLEEKTLENFYMQKGKWYSQPCKPCLNLKHRSKYSEKDAVILKNKEWENYLLEHKDGYFLKKCPHHGNLNYDQIKLIHRSNYGKIGVCLVCSLCEDKWTKDNYNENRRLDRLNKSHLECTKCKSLKPINEFIDSELRTKRIRCTSCKQDAHIKYQEKVSMSTKYKFTRLQFNEMLKQQNYVCKICGNPETAITKKGKIRSLSVDHCHTAEKNGITKIRGILCHGCNQGLGAFRDNPQYLRLAADYLDSNNEAT